MRTTRIRRRAATPLTAIAGPLIALACSDGVTGPSEPITELPRTLSTHEAALVSAGNAFAVDLLSRVYAAAPDSTVFLSPLSASMALGMTLNGAAGDTRDEMREMLGFGDIPMADVNASYRSLIDLLGGLDPRVELGLANAIFHRSTFVIETPFLDAVRSAFDARIEGLDFDAPSAAPTINAWIAEKTGGRIEKVIETIDPTTMAFLINAIYFTGDWTKEFDPSDSYDGPYRLQGGGSETVRYMTKEDSLWYRSSPEWQAVEMPYGGGAWVMTVAVPRDGYGLDDVVVDLTALFDPTAAWDRTPIQIHLPRFELEWERELNDDLWALGMHDAFVPYVADFTPMYRRGLEEGLHVQWVKQKTFLKVDEVGTEAAAVTVVAVGIECAGCGGPPVVRADRPFLIAIRERYSGTVLFAGLIVEAPTE